MPALHIVTMMEPSGAVQRLRDAGDDVAGSGLIEDVYGHVEMSRTYANAADCISDRGNITKLGIEH